MNTNLQHLPEKFAFKLDEIGKKWIKETFGTDFYDSLDDCYFNYPNFSDGKGLKEGHHLSLNKQGNDYTLISTSQLFPTQNIVPTVEKGVMMLVWSCIENDAKEREVFFFDGNYYYARSSYTKDIIAWQNAKPIPQLPEYTIEEAQEIFKFKVKCSNQSK